MLFIFSHGTMTANYANTYRFTELVNFSDILVLQNINTARLFKYTENFTTKTGKFLDKKI